MAGLRVWWLMSCLGLLAGCVVCPDLSSGEALPAACQFTKEQQETHEAMVREKQQWELQEFERGSGM